MSTIDDNPCVACPTNCCTLKGWIGLMLTKDEFERHFKGHSEALFIRLSENYVVISTKEGRVCPHLSDGGCRIYQDRPIDCRLYPYQMRLISRNARKVKLVFHTRSDCPKKSTLLIPEAEARALVMEFGKKVFGEDKTIIVVREKGPLSRLLIRIEKTISRRRFQ